MFFNCNDINLNPWVCQWCKRQSLQRWLLTAGIKLCEGKWSALGQIPSREKKKIKGYFWTWEIQTTPDKFCLKSDVFKFQLPVPKPCDVKNFSLYWLCGIGTRLNVGSEFPGSINCFLGLHTDTCITDPHLPYCLFHI